MMTLTVDFTEIDGSMLASVGGKAANLGVLSRAGLPVPQGFCVTTAAYRQVAETAGVRALVDRPHLAREALLGAEVPEHIAEAVLARYAELGADVPVAVRSSATAEDLPFASFAGQQDTYLNVVGGQAVLDAVRRCWASLWTDRAHAYREANNIDQGAVELAVVVQHMVDSQVAGVLFTANPVTGRRREAVIDANPGLGETVVSGSVNPDHFVVDTASGEIRQRRLGDKKHAIRSLAGGGTEQVALDHQGACLSDEQVRELARLGDRVERHYGSPQDTEWAIDPGGRLWLTQARPITTLFPVPDSPSNTGPGRRAYLCLSVAQGLYRPITPMGMAAFRLIGAGMARMVGVPVANPLAGPRVFAEAGQRAFVDITPVLRSRLGRDVVPRVFDLMEARSAVVFRSLYQDPDMSLVDSSRLPGLRRLLRVVLRLGLPWRFVEAVLRPEAARRRVTRIGSHLQEAIALRGNPSSRERLDHVQRFLSTSLVPMLPSLLPVAGAGFVMLALVGKLLGDKLEPGQLEAVLRGLPHNVTTEMDLELWALATRIREHGELFDTLSPAELSERYQAGELPEAVRRELAGWLARFGHRAVAEIDLGMPRWSERPEHILGVLANYLRLADPQAAPDVQFARGRAEAERTVRALVAKAGPLRGWLVGRALSRVRALAGLRETPKFFLIQALAEMRRQLGQVGVELAAAGRIERAEDVFFLTVAEALAALDGRDCRDLVAERRESYERELRRRKVPRVLLSDGSEPEASAPAATGDAMVGTSASSGRVTGTARVVLDPVGARLEPGEILVAPSTDPGWTPLFLTAGGLVMEMGGANSHGAVVAREYGIPAVVGVAEATHRIATGDRITVDGAAGTVSAAD
ncbi:phosphoenolpyruvate synthase [Kutzneria viridogrisea]|uniref:Pyruvate,water dikinase n=1 Tax=Kutzneria viridogrisea TaxID=47990 RepID=A0ABR6B7N8_9PSEU|nr:pyruvate,water dikinase [Kutzneria viridogrisea]